MKKLNSSSVDSNIFVKYFSLIAIILVLYAGINVHADDIDLIEAREIKESGLTENQYWILNGVWIRGTLVQKPKDIIKSNYKLPKAMLFDLGDGWIKLEKGTHGILYREESPNDAHLSSLDWILDTEFKVSSVADSPAGVTEKEKSVAIRTLNADISVRMADGNIFMLDAHQAVEVLIMSVKNCQRALSGKK